MVDSVWWEMGDIIKDALEDEPTHTRGVRQGLARETVGLQAKAD